MLGEAKAISGATGEASGWLAAFGSALARRDAAAAAEMFEGDGYWRDLVAFTWNIATFQGRDAIRAMLEATLRSVRPDHWRIEGEARARDGTIEAWLSFETAAARGAGILRLRGGKCWTLLTSMEELKGYEEKKGQARDRGVEHGVFRGRKNWAERKAEDEAALGTSKQPYCVIVGGGQGGIALGARLRRLGVPTIILEKNPRAGDSWRNRYRSLCLHDAVWYDHMPYLPFPDDWPVFSPKDKIGDWLEMYTKIMELNYWTSSTCRHASYDAATGEWTVVVDRAGETVTLRPKQLVLATGMSSVPIIPEIPGAQSFLGEQHHSSRHKGGEGYAGKHCVIVGANNSAHDIAADLWENGADVTMIQRSPTCVVRSDTLMEMTAYPLYSERAVAAGITTDKADLISASWPYGAQPVLTIPVYQEIRRMDADFYEGLRRAGFLLGFGADESGLAMMYFRRGSGYYIDVGASELIIDGKIRLKSGVNVSAIREHSVVLSDGTELPADLIVYATGYGSMNGWAAELISQEVADRVGKCWGLGSGTTKDPGPWEGELRNMWKPTQQPGLWFQGGNLHQSRHYSQFLSLQLKARMEGIPTPVYGLAPVHHLS